MLSAMVRVWVMTRPDDVTPNWVRYEKDGVEFAVPPMVGDVIMVAGDPGMTLQSVGEGGSTSWAPSDHLLVMSITVEKRFFGPDGALVLDAAPPGHLALRDDDDDENTPADEIWGRLDWGALAAVLVYAGYEEQIPQADTPIG